MDTTFKEFTPKLGEVKPVDIFSLERRKFDEKTVTDLVEALDRDGRFQQQIAVRDEGASGYRLIFGGHRLEAWKRHFGKQTPVPAMIYPSDTPDALITVLEIEENLLRKELTAAEREAQTIRLAAALKKLKGGTPATPVSESGEAAETGNQIPSLRPARGGRGNKGVAQQVAEKLGIGKRAVNMRRTSAAAAIGEEIDFDDDTPEELERKAAELERKADRRQHAGGKIVLKRRKPALYGEDPTLAEPQAGEFDSQIEDLWKSYAAIGRKYRLRFIHDACLRDGLDPLKMAPPSVFGLADDEPELAVDLPAEVTPATDAGAMDSQVVQQDDTEEPGSEDLQAPDDNLSDAADEEDLSDEDLQDGDDGSEAADQEPSDAAACANCHHEIWSGDPAPEVINGRPYHRGHCAEYGRRIAKAAEEASRHSGGLPRRTRSSRVHRADAQDETIPPGLKCRTADSKPASAHPRA